MTYKDGSINSGIRIGDIVTIIRAAHSMEDGWQLGWVESMNDLVGRSSKVINVDHYDGIVTDIDKRFRFPYFVLRKGSNSFLEIE